MFATPQKEHEWLQQLVGTWRIEGAGDCVPGQDPIKSTGEETVRMLGGLWMIAEGTMQMQMQDGDAGFTHMTIGFDPAKNKFVGTWQGSMMTHLWIYEGELDATGKILPLNSVGPSFAGDGTMQNYQDIIEIVSPDHRILRSQVQGPDGTWNQFMQADYYRVK